MNTTNPSVTELIALSQKAAQTKNGKKYIDLAKELCRAFGIGSEVIEATELDPGHDSDDEVAVLRKKIVKAGLSALRKAIANLALEKGVVSLNQPLPAVGYWQATEAGRVLLRIGTLGHFFIGGSEEKKPTSICPFKNPQFLDLLRAAI